MLQYCTFWVGELFIGIEVSRVQEVLSHSSITPVPLAPVHVKGLINLRGHIVTAIDMGIRLDVGGVGSAGGDMMHVILNDDQGLLSLVVDRAGDVVEGDKEAHVDPPDGLPLGLQLIGFVDQDAAMFAVARGILSLFDRE